MQKSFAKLQQFEKSWICEIMNLLNFEFVNAWTCQNFEFVKSCICEIINSWNNIIKSWILSYSSLEEVKNHHNSKSKFLSHNMAKKLFRSKKEKYHKKEKKIVWSSFLYSTILAWNWNNISCFIAEDSSPFLWYDLVLELVPAYIPQKDI